MIPVRCHRLLCRKIADVTVGRHFWCAAHGLERLARMKREQVVARG